MTTNPPMPHQLVDHPELATLELLESALGVTRSALLAIHPQATSWSFFRKSPGPTALSCLAISIATQGDALLMTLARYRDCAAHQEELSRLQRDVARAVAAGEPDDDIPF